jgi:Protein of unknown function (DUF4232)
MTDDEVRLEEVLRDKASEVPQFQELPAKTAGRAKRRVGRNVAASILVAGFVLIAASWGISNLRSPTQVVPGGSPTSQAPLGNGCSLPDLTASAKLDGAAGSVEGLLFLTNGGTTSCTLSGRPTILLEPTSGQTLNGEVVINGAPEWKKYGSPEPPGWPVVTLDPDSSASATIRWSNACPQIEGAVRWEITDASGSVMVDPSRTTLVPPCNGPSEPSTLEVGPYEPVPTLPTPTAQS